MAASRTRKTRGARTQVLVAEWYQRLWPAATSAGSGAKGSDILNIPFDVEVKARREFSPLEWVRQGKRRDRGSGGILPPHVVLRPDGLGEASVGEWLVIRTLADDTDLISELLALRAGRRAESEAS